MSNFVGKFKGYTIYLSDKPQKKYYAIVNNRKVYFGQYPYQQYRDKLGYYSDLDHLDKQRRKNFKSRFERYRHRKGSSAYFSDQILW
jgi:capsid portal protein